MKEDRVYPKTANAAAEPTFPPSNAAKSRTTANSMTNDNSNTESGRIANSILVALILLSFSVCGCQIANPNQSTSSGTKSISQIAKDSLQTVGSEIDEFKTLESPIDSRNQGSGNRNQNRNGTSRPQRTRPVSTAPNSSAFVDEIFDQTDIREALQAIASQSNVSIIVDDQVAGTVTALIQNEPLEQALRKVLLPLGLHYRIVNGDYLVCSADPTSPMFSIISDRLDYTPVHTAPTELVELLAEQNRQFVRIAPKRNMLIVEAPTEIANRIYEELQRFDQPVSQVVLEAMVVVVTPDSGFQFGSNLRQGIAPVEGENSDFNLALDGLALSGSLSGAVASNLFRRFAVTSFFIRALEQEGYLTIRATPHVMAKHGEKAEISIARETFFSIQPADSQQFFRQDIQKVEAGISLIITPTIRGDNVNMLIEKAEVSEDIRATVSDPAVNNPFPLINRRQVSTTVNVKDGETIVIGGLMQNQLVDRVSSVPVLGNLPLVGRFFTQITQEEQAAEVVVFISPRIVKNSSDHPFAGAEHIAAATDEFAYQRRFQRNNGQEIGGPVATAYDQECLDNRMYEQGIYEQGIYEQGMYEQPYPPAAGEQFYQQPTYQNGGQYEQMVPQMAPPMPNPNLQPMTGNQQHLQRFSPIPSASHHPPQSARSPYAHRPKQASHTLTPTPSNRSDSQTLILTADPTSNRQAVATAVPPRQIQKWPSMPVTTAKRVPKSDHVQRINPLRHDQSAAPGTLVNFNDSNIRRASFHQQLPNRLRSDNQ